MRYSSATSPRIVGREADGLSKFLKIKFQFRCVFSLGIETKLSLFVLLPPFPFFFQNNLPYITILYPSPPSPFSLYSSPLKFVMIISSLNKYKAYLSSYVFTT